MELLNNGAHIDYTNKFGECPHTGYLKSNSFFLHLFVYYLLLIYYDFLALFHLTIKTPLSLKCLSAKVVNRQFSKEWFQNQLPLTLQDFTNLH